ncbi:MAG: hypothetical protein RL199_208 [Pseudomonadota bacterium]
MTSLLWTLRTLDEAEAARFVARIVVLMVLYCWDHPILLAYRSFQRLFGLDRTARDHEARPLPLLVVIPSLLRSEGELTSMMSTVSSIVGNGYPGPLTLVVSIDGTLDRPEMYRSLKDWAGTLALPSSCGVHVTGTPERRSKPMAIEHGVEYVHDLVRSGSLAAFPPVYVSTDADADLGPRALERIVYRLQRRNRFTGWPARAVAGALHVRGNEYWPGWRRFFTVRGQLNLQVAREYYVGNIWRYNIRWLPVTGIPGAFYCTWSEIFLAVPAFLGHSRSLKRGDWWRWWLGERPLTIAQSGAPPLPELMAGDTDDTVTAYVAAVARYEGGHFVVDPPRSPWHALVLGFRTLFIDRPLQFEPEAHVFTSSPTTVASLMKQRKRWNSSRVELMGRVWPALHYHWGLAVPAWVEKVFLARGILLTLAGIVLFPLVLLKVRYLELFVVGYLVSAAVFGVFTVSAMLINGDLRYWRMLTAVPFAPAYRFFFSKLTGAYGVLSDLLLFGNRTGFSPETTLKLGNSARVALAFRLRRGFLLACRAVWRGDVPFGLHWFGWRETRWAPGGFEGWTTGRRRSILPALPVPGWVGRLLGRPPPPAPGRSPAAASAPTKREPG